MTYRELMKIKEDKIKEIYESSEVFVKELLSSVDESTPYSYACSLEQEEDEIYLILFPKMKLPKGIDAGYVSINVLGNERNIEVFVGHSRQDLEHYKQNRQILVDESIIDYIDALYVLEDYIRANYKELL